MILRCKIIPELFHKCFAHVNKILKFYGQKHSIWLTNTLQVLVMSILERQEAVIGSRQK